MTATQTDARLLTVVLDYFESFADGRTACPDLSDEARDSVRIWLDAWVAPLVEAARDNLKDGTQIPGWMAYGVKAGAIGPTAFYALRSKEEPPTPESRVADTSVEAHPFRVGAMFFRTEEEARTFAREAVEKGISPVALVDRRTGTVLASVGVES